MEHAACLYVFVLWLGHSSMHKDLPIKTISVRVRPGDTQWYQYRLPSLQGASSYRCCSAYLCRARETYKDTALVKYSVEDNSTKCVYRGFMSLMFLCVYHHKLARATMQSFSALNVYQWEPSVTGWPVAQSAHTSCRGDEVLQIQSAQTSFWAPKKDSNSAPTLYKSLNSGDRVRTTFCTVVRCDRHI